MVFSIVYVDHSILSCIFFYLDFFRFYSCTQHLFFSLFSLHEKKIKCIPSTQTTETNITNILFKAVFALLKIHFFNENHRYIINHFPDFGIYVCLTNVKRYLQFSTQKWYGISFHMIYKFTDEAFFSVLLCFDFIWQCGNCGRFVWVPITSDTNAYLLYLFNYLVCISN